jgi:predicted 3-demethylubiquinone-9 3-methyltransferase (glyoxalase superfamily)
MDESRRSPMHKVNPFLWFEKDTEEAVEFYVSVFDDAKITSTTRYLEGGPGPVGEVMTMTFTIADQEFIALNGGPQRGFTFTSAISFVVNCENQEEVDRLWDQLSEGGEQQQCGWLVDRYGVTWQIVPTVLGEMLSDSDRTRAQRVMQAMLKMNKIEIKPLQDAYNHG